MPENLIFLKLADQKLRTACIHIKEANFHKNTLPSVIFVYLI